MRRDKIYCISLLGPTVVCADHKTGPTTENDVEAIDKGC